MTTMSGYRVRAYPNILNNSKRDIKICRIARYFYKEFLNTCIVQTIANPAYFLAIAAYSMNAQLLHQTKQKWASQKNPQCSPLLIKTPSYTQRDQVYATEETNYAQRTKTKRGKFHIQKREQYRIKAERKKKIIGVAK